MGLNISDRFTSLRPRGERVANPIKLLVSVNRKQWMFFLVSFLAWTWDAFDFFTVSLTVSQLATQFNKSKTEISWGITLVLMFRTIGSVLFGIVSDRYGRKWPFVINNVLFVILQLGTGFTNTYAQFLAVRALFGIAMGGLYGNAAATALEDAPEAAKGLLSGMMQQGYAFGYLLATVFARALVDTTPSGWRAFFWFSAGPPVLLIVFRCMLPETEAFTRRKASQSDPSRAGFFVEAKTALKENWLTLIYLVLLMSGFNFMSHGSQDLYPTMLENQYNFSANKVTIVQVVANLGAMAGGMIVGYLSQSYGRRLSMITMCVVAGALLYPYTFVSNDGVIAAAFFEQFCVQGAWGVIPVHLLELSPPSFQTFVVGTSYQLGNLVSSASSTIEATIGERFPLPPMRDGNEIIERYEYGKVICIFLGCVFAYTLLLILIGPESGHNDDLASSTDGLKQDERSSIAPNGDHEVV